MLTDKSRKILIAVIVVLVILAAATYWYRRLYTVRVLVSGLSLLSDGSLTIMGSTAAGVKSNPSTWAGKKIKLHVKSLSGTTSTVASADYSGGAGGGTLTIKTAPGATLATGTYIPSEGDYVRIMLR